MKKLLLASTALIGLAGAAAADVTVSGYGRFGLNYNDGAAVGMSKTTVDMRMRLNIDGSVETDSGVTFGGRVRLQYDEGNATTNTAPAMLYVSYEGIRVEVGNSNTAYDSAALMYNSEIGYTDRGAGDPQGAFLAYNSGPYGDGIDCGLGTPAPTACTYDATQDESNRMGIMASYSVGDFNVRLSYINPDQTVKSSTLPVGVKAETGISLDYTFGQITVSAAAVQNGAYVDGNDQYFLGAEYAINSDANVGILYFDNGDFTNGTGLDEGEQVTLYGNYTQGAITYKAYVSNWDNPNFGAGMTDTAYGLGLDYDLGGARLAADIHRTYAKDTVAGLGVRFDF